MQTKRKHLFRLGFLLLIMLWLHHILKQRKFSSNDSDQEEQLLGLKSSMKDYQNIKEKLFNALDKASQNRKKILFWRPRMFPYFSDDQMLEFECGSCTVTYNISKINDPNTAAVIFPHFASKSPLFPKKSERRTDQFHVFKTLESTSYFTYAEKKNFTFEDEYQFNATMSYRRDADIYFPFNFCLEDFETNLTKILKMKNKFSVALVSNCDIMPGSRIRLQYLKLLKTMLPMDGFGKCFGDTVRKTTTKNILINLMQEYKFYFAFENSYHCKDYITEKFFFNGFTASTLPVVMGASRKDYEAIAPPKSFIHVEDFSSIYQLVKYLKYLDSNDTAYLEHFRWRTSFQLTKKYFAQKRATRFCQLCRIINGINVDDIHHPNYNSSSPQRPLFTDSVSHRTTASVSKWMKNDAAECFSKKFELSNSGVIVPSF